MTKMINGSVQVDFCGLRFWSNRLEHSVKRFARVGLDTLLPIFQKTATFKTRFGFTNLGQSIVLGSLSLRIENGQIFR